MTATDERPQRPAKPQRATPFVTVYKEDGTPVPYPKAQIHRIEKSEILFLDDPTAVEFDPEVSFPAPTGGGWYELSDGSRVKGKTDAEDQQKELDNG